MIVSTPPPNTTSDDVAELRERLIALLDELAPLLEDELVALLREARITGRVGVACECAVARYLQRRLSLTVPRVGLTYVNVYVDKELFVELPDNLSLLARHVDVGQYPDLVTTNAVTP